MARHILLILYTCTGNENRRESARNVEKCLKKKAKQAPKQKSRKKAEEAQKNKGKLNQKKRKRVSNFHYFTLFYSDLRAGKGRAPQDKKKEDTWICTQMWIRIRGYVSKVGYGYGYWICHLIFKLFY